MAEISFPVTRRGDRDASTAVVFVHGVADQGGSFKRVAKHLSDMNCFWYNRAGYGDRKDTSPHGELAAEIRDLVEVVDVARSESPVVVLAGHSLGGVISIAAAAQHPVVHSVVVYEPPTPWGQGWITEKMDVEDRKTSMARFGAWIADLSTGGATGGDHRGRTTQWSIMGRSILFDTILMSDSEFPSCPAAPLWCMYGTETEPSFLPSLETLQQHWAGIELRPVLGAEHLGHRTHSDQFAAVVREAIEQVYQPQSVSDQTAVDS